jgi:hypothetical protein
MDDQKTEMSTANYEALLERIKQQDETINALKKSTEDVIKLNRQLLSTSDNGAPRVDMAKRHTDLEQKLKEGLRNA